MPNKYEYLLDLLEPYVITYGVSDLNLTSSMLHSPIKDELKVEPLNYLSTPFVEKIYKLDELAFGSKGMGMPRWVLVDCAAMPGFIVGFAIKASSLSSSDKALFGEKFFHDTDYFPLSMYIAIPTKEKGVWFGHNLSSLNGKMELNLSGLGFLTKLVALDLFNIKTLRGATQWNSQAVFIHHKFSALRLLSALTPIHSHELSFVYESKLTKSSSELLSNSLLKDNFEKANIFEPNYINCRELQKRIESKKNVYIEGVTKINDKMLYNLN